MFIHVAVLIIFYQLVSKPYTGPNIVYFTKYFLDRPTLQIWNISIESYVFNILHSKVKYSKEYVVGFSLTLT